MFEVTRLSIMEVKPCPSHCRWSFVSQESKIHVSNGRSFICWSTYLY